MSLKIALNAVTLPKFEAVNGKSWSLRTMVVKIFAKVERWRDFAYAQNAVWSLAQGHRYTVLADNSISFNHSAIKVVIVNRQIGVRDFKYVGKNAPTHRSRDTAHAQWLQILWLMSELITQERIAVESSNLVEGLTTWPALYDYWPRSKGQRSKSQGHVTYQQQ